MINIVIKESNALFRCGLTAFFSDFFWRERGQTIGFNFTFTPESVKNADIIVLSLCPGECFTCLPELHARQKGIIIGFVDDDRRACALPSCFEDIIFISRRASLARMRQELCRLWHNLQRPEYHQQAVSCFDCQQKYLSPQQIRIMIGLHKGMTVLEIANKLRISGKTVFTHKYMAMQKFNLRSDYELVLWMNRLAEKNNWPAVFRDELSH